jgi:hypothetical protein
MSWLPALFLFLSGFYDDLESRREILDEWGLEGVRGI